MDRLAVAADMADAPDGAAEEDTELVAAVAHIRFVDVNCGLVGSPESSCLLLEGHIHQRSPVEGEVVVERMPVCVGRNETARK